MKCELINRNEIIADYISGELPEQKMIEFEKHYFICNDCFEDLRIAEDAVSLIEKEGHKILKVPIPWWAKIPEYFKNKFLSILSWFLPHGYLRYVYLTLSLVIIVNIGGYIFYLQDSTRDTQIEIPQSTKIGFRDVSVSSHEDQELNKFRYQYSLAMSEYQSQKYEETIEILHQLEHTLVSIQDKMESKTVNNWERELNFFLGISYYLYWVNEKDSYLAWATKKIKLKEEGSQFIIEAIKYLRIAETVALQIEPDRSDREIYYLGRSLGFNKQKDEAIKKLKKIVSKSLFYKSSIALIKEWKN